jgi:hypothetical protein
VQFKLSSDSVRNLLNVDPLDMPKYVAPLLNLANKTSGGTRPRVVGKVTELIKEIDGGTLEEWEAWYSKHHGDKLEIAKEKIKEMVQNFRTAMECITDEVIDEWVKDLVIVKTYIGLNFQEAIFREISKRLNVEFRPSTAEEESKGIDGWLNNQPVSVKPASYRTKPELSEDIPRTVIFYEKSGSEILIDLNEQALLLP